MTGRHWALRRTSLSIELFFIRFFSFLFFHSTGAFHRVRITVTNITQRKGREREREKEIKGEKECRKKEQKNTVVAPL